MDHKTIINNELRAKIERDIELFFAKGGKVTQCEPCQFAKPEGGKATVDRGFKINDRLFR